jgi:hypothetical protein
VPREVAKVPLRGAVEPLRIGPGTSKEIPGWGLTGKPLEIYSGASERYLSKSPEVPMYFFRGPRTIPQRLYGTSQGNLGSLSWHKKVERRKYIIEAA